MANKMIKAFRPNNGNLKVIFKTFLLSLFIVLQVHFAYAQTASILPNAKTVFLDKNGKPLTSGTVDFYVPGTTTRNTTWQDSGQTIPNTNPVILDGAGGALIWGTGSYRQVVKDRNGNLIWDQVTSSAGGGSSGGGGSIGDSNSVGAIVPWPGINLPAQYMYAAGQAVSRTTYSLLYGILTQTESATCTGGNPTLTAMSDTSQLNVGAVVESICVATGSTIISKTSTTVTLSANATISTTANAIFYPYGNGDGLTTFNLPDYRGVVLPGRNNMNGVASSILTSTYYTDPNATFGGGGSQNFTITVANLPPYTPTGTVGVQIPVFNLTNVSGSTDTTHLSLANNANASAGNFTNTVDSFTGTAQGGTSTPFSLIQPSRTINYIIKVLPNPSLTTAFCSNLQDAGTACQANTGTSGHKVPFLDGSNVFSGASNTFTNGVTVNSLPAALFGRPSNSAGPDSDFTIQGLVARGAPDANNDKLIIYDNASQTLKYVTPGLIASSGASGVSSLGGQTGVITCGVGTFCSGNSISTAFIAPTTATCNGSADDSAALVAWKNAINASSAVALTAILPPLGSCNLASATVPTGLVITRSNVTIDCLGAYINVTGGTSVNAVFVFLDQSNIRIKNCYFNGNNVASGTGFGVGSAINYNNSTLDISGFKVENSYFTNFAGNYWIYIQTLSPYAHAIQDIDIHDNTFISQSGNCLGPTNIGINCSFVLAYGVGNSGASTPSPNSYVRGIKVTNNFMRADYMKTGVQIFENAQDAYVSGNQIYNNGQLGGQTDDHGSYAIMAYENEGAGQPAYSKHVIFADNYIFNARDNCFYMAGQWTNSVFNANTCDTQTSTATGTLPKGGISINGGLCTTVTSNRLWSIAGDGITLVAPATSSFCQWMIANNSVNASLNGAIKFQSSSGSDTASVSIINNNLNPTGGTAYGIYGEVFSGSAPGTTYTDLKIDGNTIRGGVYGIRLFADSGSYSLFHSSVSRNLVSYPTGVGIDVSNQNGGSMTLDGNVVAGAPTSYSYNIGANLVLMAQGNQCIDQNSGFCWTTAGAQGTLRNNSFRNVPLANVVQTLGSTDLGRVTPTFSYQAGGVVQNLIAAETGTAGVKYVLREWYYDVGGSGWLQQQLKTGN